MRNPVHVSAHVLRSAPVARGFNSNGWLRITVDNADLLSRYKFSMKPIEFLV